MQNHPTDALETVGDFIRWSASQFVAAELCFGHGTDNALDEAAALVLGTLRLPADLHPIYFQCRITPPERSALMANVRERIERRRPVPYLLGEAWFCGLAFTVTEAVLIPRSPIAELIEADFRPWVDSSRVEQIVDVGTGSGCIAIASALAFTNAKVTALDCSKAALAIARDNVERYGVSEQVSVQASDWLSAIPPQPMVDLIISNPPYVDARAMAELPAEYRHEPRGALASGQDGLDAVRALLPQAAQRLTDHGVLVVEIGHGAAMFEQVFADLPVTWIELERGGAGVFVIDAASLRQAFPGADAQRSTE